MDVRIDLRIGVWPNTAMFHAACSECHCIKASGRFVVGFTLEDSRYFYGGPTMQQCCGVDQTFPLLFQDEAAAEQVKQNLIRDLQDHPEKIGELLVIPIERYRVIPPTPDSVN